MEKLKSFLKKWPSLYRLTQFCYGKAQRFIEYVTRTNIDEKEEKRWENRHLKEGNNWAVGTYWEVRNHPASHFLVKRLASFSPFSSILEIGCNCGPNLYLIAKKFPHIEIKGIDINPLAVQKGNELLNKEGVKNVELLVGRANNLSQFSDKSFDIVFAKAVLCHIGPSKINKVIKEMSRLSKKAVILVNYHESYETDQSSVLGIRLGDSWRWKRNWVALLKQVVPKSKIVLTKIPKEIWGDEWGEMGYIIEVGLKS